MQASQQTKKYLKRRRQDRQTMCLHGLKLAVAHHSTAQAEPITFNNGVSEVGMPS